MSRDLEDHIAKIDPSAIIWRLIEAEELYLQYGHLFNKQLASKILAALEEEITYYTPQMCKVRVFGKLHQIPRQQVAHSDPDIVYRFSGSAIPGKPWTPLLACIRDRITALTGIYFNFVLINRYRNGDDHIGEHRDSEPELDSAAPIASLSLGAERDFILRHSDLVHKRRDVPKIKLRLEHGSLLLMRPPTNAHWYHSLPVRKTVREARINLTFRKFRLLLES